MLQSFSEDIVGKSVIELGSGAGLPSLVAMSMGAHKVVSTDYPSDSVLNNLEKNLRSCSTSNTSTKQFYVHSHIWGTDTQNLISLNGSCQYDTAIAAECLWKHSEHISLLTSLSSLLKLDGVALLSFSHHIPGLESADLNFIDLATENFGFEICSSIIRSAPHMWNSERIVEIYIYKLVKTKNIHM